jgi:hypothetical protein
MRHDAHGYWIAEAGVSGRPALPPLEIPEPPPTPVSGAVFVIVI